MDTVIKDIAYSTYLSNLLQTAPVIGAFSSVMILGGTFISLITSFCIGGGGNRDGMIYAVYCYFNEAIF